MTRQMRHGLFALLGLLIARMAAMVMLPLADTTEARYGEMARKMLETGNWVTPMHDYGVPFLAKPPLWAWMSAASMGAFGVNEFAARLPALILSVLTVWLVWTLASVRNGRGAGMTPAVILSSSIGFFACAGTVMTDPALVFSTTLILVAFWIALHGGGRVWGWLFFAGCGIGLLAKGPVALVLAGLPVFFWTLRRRAWRELWAGLPWLRGSALTAVIAAPWYVLAEIRTPGFLNYFLLGEHFGRFFDKGWTGDRYGFAHAYPHGMVWVFAFLSFVPWVFFLRPRRQVWRDEDGWMLFLALWAGCGLVFFSAASNIIWPYALPALPACVLMAADILRRRGAQIPLLPLAAVAGLVGFAAPVLIQMAPGKIDVSHRDVIRAWAAADPTGAGALVFWPYKSPQFSAAFYSKGKARTVLTDEALHALLANKTRDFIVCPVQDLSRLPPRIARSFTEVGRYDGQHGLRVLLREKAAR